MAKVPKVDFFRIEDWTFALLPSEKAAFKEELRRFATPFEYMLNLRGPAYRLPTDCLVPLYDLITKYYPRWRIVEHVPLHHVDIPPWGQCEAIEFLEGKIADPPTWKTVRGW